MTEHRGGRCRLQSSSGCLVAYSGICVNPIRFPGLPAISGERLLRMDLCCGDRPDHEADEYVASVKELAVVEFTASAVESTNSRDAEHRGVTGCEADVPLLSPRIAEA